jgi:hypothetical protein
MQALIAAILTVLAEFAPAATATQITGIINALVALVPVVTQLIPELLTNVNNIIAALKANNSITQDQLVQLQAAETILDAETEALLQQDLADDAAAAAAPPVTPPSS